eukprot:5153615-Pyramimonas_sp.AAC.1
MMGWLRIVPGQTSAIWCPVVFTDMSGQFENTRSGKRHGGPWHIQCYGRADPPVAPGTSAESGQHACCHGATDVLHQRTAENARLSHRPAATDTSSEVVLYS